MPSEEQLDELALQVDDELRELASQPAETATVRAVPDPHELPDIEVPKRQLEIVREGSPDGFESFWQKYLRLLREDLCLEGGELNKVWIKYRDIDSKTLVRKSWQWLVLLGYAQGAVPAASVAISVIVLNILAKVGIKAICEGCGAEEQKQ